MPSEAKDPIVKIPCLSLNQAWSVGSDECREAVVFYSSGRHKCPQLGVERAEHLKDSCQASALKVHFQRIELMEEFCRVTCSSSFFNATSKVLLDIDVSNWGSREQNI